MARRKLLLDAGIALLALALTLGLLASRGAAEPAAGTRSLDVLGGFLAALASVPLVARRRAPLAVFVTTAAASIVLNAAGYPPGPPVGATLALYFLVAGRDESRTRMWLTGGVVAGAFALHLGGYWVGQDELPGAPILFGVLLWGGVWVAGDRTRLRRERMAELEERALRAEREAERERRLAAAEERARIARDLHDSAGHAVNVILVQAGAARLLREQDPGRAQAALETIEEVARDTVREIDRLVHVLREDDGDEARTVEPPPGLAALGTLAERHRAAGLDAALHVRGPRRTLLPGVDQAAYRIVQESLTNAAKHGGGTADVEVRFGSDALEIVIANPPATDESSRSDGGGYGIAGMRERASLLGGTLDAGVDEGLFRVRARLPYAPGEAS